MLSKHAEDIMRILIHQNNSFVTNKKIAKMLEISERSINNYMQEVSDYCEQKGYTLIRKRGRGICLEMGIYEEELKKNFAQKRASFENREARINYIVRTLIQSGEPYTASLFADELYVSRATIRTDLEKANEQCKKDELSIYQVTGKGIEIKGNEFKKRKVLVCRNQKVPAAYYDQMDEVPDLRMEKENYSRIVSQYLKSTVDGVIDCIQCLEKEIVNLR
jgi:transcriptional antiterminator